MTVRPYQQKESTPMRYTTAREMYALALDYHEFPENRAELLDSLAEAAEWVAEVTRMLTDLAEDPRRTLGHLSVQANQERQAVRALDNPSNPFRRVSPWEGDDLDH